MSAVFSVLLGHGVHSIEDVGDDKRIRECFGIQMKPKTVASGQLRQGEPKLEFERSDNTQLFVIFVHV